MTVLPPATGVKWSRRNFRAGPSSQAKNRGQLRNGQDHRSMGVVSTGWSRAGFSCGQGVKHEKLLGQDFDPGRGWEYSRLCSVTPLTRGLDSSFVFSKTDVKIRHGDPL